MVEVGSHFLGGDWEEARDSAAGEECVLMMSCSEGCSWGLGVRICCTSLLTLRDTSLCDGNLYWLLWVGLHRI